MRTPKRLYTDERRIYHAEITECPHCGESMTLAPYLSWDKTVQTLEGVLSVASRPALCPNPLCPAYRSPVLSAHALQIAPVGFGYGYDLLVRIGWRRQESRETFAEIHQALAEQVQISESHVRYLYHQVYLPLLACRECSFEDRLARAAQTHGGLLIALDGLAPEGGEPQVWFVRELTTGLTLRSGWMSSQDQSAFESFLAPLAQMKWPIRAVLSDKQKGLVPALATVLPESPHAFCQAHYLTNLASPLAGADRTLNVAIRKAVRERIGSAIRSESTEGTTPGVLTVTGLRPSPLPDPDGRTPSGAPPAKERRGTLITEEAKPSPERETEPTEEPQAGGPVAPVTEGDEITGRVVMQLQRRIRYLLTLDSRPPRRFAGIETFTRLREVADFCDELRSYRDDPRLLHLAEGIRQALAPFDGRVEELRHGVAWVEQIAQLLDPEDGTTGKAVAESLRDYLDGLEERPEASSFLDGFREHLDKVSRSYWSGLFHSYDLPGLPRTNNGLEGHFRETRRRLIRTTGQKGQTNRTLQRTGAWELLPRPTDEASGISSLRQVDPTDLSRERDRLRQHQERFRLHVRSSRQVAMQFDRLREQWRSLSATSSG